MTVRISVLCPTRGRSALMKRLAKNCFKTCDNPNQIELIFGLDDDDPDSINEAKRLQDVMKPNKIEYIVWEAGKYVFSDLINQCSKPAIGEIFNIMSDDAVHESGGWDTKALETFDNSEDKIILLQTAGGASPQTGFPFMHRNWRDAVGYILAPIFQGDWADLWLADVMRGLPGNRFLYREDIVIKHYHVEFGMMEKDETYHKHHKERMEQEALPRDKHPYHGTFGTQMKNEEIEKLRSFIENYK